MEWTSTDVAGPLNSLISRLPNIAGRVMIHGNFIDRQSAEETDGCDAEHGGEGTRGLKPAALLRQQGNTYVT